MKKKGRRIFGPATSLFVGHSPILGMLPPQRLVASPNLRPRHLRLFMRWLLGSLTSENLNVRSRMRDADLRTMYTTPRPMKNNPLKPKK